MLESGDDDRLRVFYLLFRRDSFVLRDGAVATFLDGALAEGRRYEEQVAQDLSSVVFEKVFPKLVEALADASGESLPDVRHAALIFLYRLFFVLYAEDRGLLPVNDSRYDDYGLRKRVRDDIRDSDTQTRRIFRRRHTLLRPPDEPVQDHRRWRRIDRASALQRRPVLRGSRPGCWSVSACPMRWSRPSCTTSATRS